MFITGTHCRKRLTIECLHTPSKILNNCAHISREGSVVATFEVFGLPPLPVPNPAMIAGAINDLIVDGNLPGDDGTLFRGE